MRNETLLSHGWWSTFKRFGSLTRVIQVVALAISVATLLSRSTVAQESVSENLEKLSGEIDELYDQGKYGEAVPKAKRCIELATDAFGPDHKETGLALNWLAILFREQREYREAEPLYVRALKIAEQYSEPDHPDTAALLIDLGAVYMEQAKYELAEQFALRALRILEQKLGLDHPMTATALNNLGFIYFSQGKFGQAEPLYLRALKISEEKLTSDHIQTAWPLNNLANLYSKLGKFEKAEPLLLRALQIREKQLGGDHQDTATSLYSLAGLYLDQGKYEQAETLYVRALNIREMKFGSDHPETASLLNALAFLYDMQGKYEQAEPLYVRALRIRDQQRGPDHPDTANTLGNLAGLYDAQGKYEEAKPLYVRALKIREEKLGLIDPGTASLLHNLAYLYEKIGNFEEAEVLYFRALNITEDLLGADHPDTSTSLYTIAFFYFSMEEHSKAYPLIQRSLVGQHDHQTRMLSYFSERDCLAMQSLLASTNLAGNCLNGELAATEQIWFKGAVLEGMNRRRIAEASLTSTDEGAQLLAQRQSLASTYQNAVIQGEANSEGTKQIESQLSDLERQIAVSFDGEVANLQIGMIGLPEVRANLGKSEVLVESFRFGYRIIDNIWGKCYSTALIRGTGESDYIAHKWASTIEEAIENYRRAVLNKDEKLSSDERQSLLAESEKALYEQYISPIEAKLSAGDIVIFSLDAQLHFIPPGMLRDENGIPFGEKYNVRYVTSGRDLVKEVPKRVNGAGSRKALVLGNPTYRDNAPLMALAAAEEEKAALALASNLRAGMTNDAASINLKPLPGTAREVAQLEGKLKSNGYEVTSLTTKRASEEALKQSIEGCDVVHLATHGFFLDEIEIGNGQHGLSMTEDTKVKPNTIQDPMYRSGLALSGAQSTFNLWKNGEVPPPSQDGILMAAEAALLDLRGTDLIVLSACETGNGKALDGEGVMGLRRALSAAGATNTILTLWPVDDRATVEVMEAFYEKYLNGTPAPKALAEVQRELLGKWTEEFGAAEAVARLGPFICTSVGPVEVR